MLKMARKKKKYNLKLIVISLLVLTIISLDTILHDFAFAKTKSTSEVTLSSSVELNKQLTNSVLKELNIIEYLKNVGYYTTDEAIIKVLSFDKVIEQKSYLLKVPKAMIQAILFKELRMIDFRDSMSDIFVKACFDLNSKIYNIHLKTPTINLIDSFTSTKGSSTGIGQIFPETAILAQNWGCNNLEIIKSKKMCSNSVKHCEEMWNTLTNELDNIHYVVLILRYEAENNLNINLIESEKQENYDDIKKVFSRYNGSCKYGDEVIVYYNIFKEYNINQSQISINK